MEDAAVQFEDDSESGIEINERMFTLIGAAGAVMNLVAFSAVGYLALESVAYGVIAGVFGSVGSYLFLPWFMGISAVQEQVEEEIGFTEASRHVPASAQLGVLGAGLEVGSIVAIGVGLSLAEPDPLIGAGAAIAATLVIYLVGSTLLDV
ncbi:hypothetical protein [Natranaeroarchaeum sulfidigenes]|uniref:Putative membrane protein n=1 Tax=Natranaeroarchaeum sulfidigenes TaxID=2784880 RepID=A0A897MYS8_9EURY|nr:hypothetical protein [Natranaeroarchaeum sulfidigenes]QSG03276.1 putative membrane protein [Natranaeroarchaeum sulfidigenes]